MNLQRRVNLTPPCFAQECIKEKIICIRAHRERIFNVSVQMQGDKLLCHNYGQGGAGWTFLFGCVYESIRQLESALEQNSALKNKPIAVIGAGCYGLLTAIMLARSGYTVRIIASDFENIASNKAAGFFFPRPRTSSTAQECAIFQALGMESYAVYLQIMQGKHPFITHGPKLLPAYYGLDIDPGFASYHAQGLIAVPEKVIIDFGNGKAYEVMEHKTIFINPAAIMQELQRNVAHLGIAKTRAHVETINDLEEPIVINCAGLSAKNFAGDKRVVPVQGHLIMLKDQPAMELLQYMVNVKVVMRDALGRLRDELIYYAPKESGIVGITFLRGQDSLTANQHEFDRLIERCQNFFGT